MNRNPLTPEDYFTAGLALGVIICGGIWLVYQIIQTYAF